MRTVSQNQSDPHRYDDMLNMPHHISTNHHPMPLLERAAQFSPFAALTGYEEMIEEASRLPEQKRYLSEEKLEDLDEKIKIIEANLGSHPQVQFTLFQEDAKKEGGRTVKVTGHVQNIDGTVQTIYLENHAMIPIKEIIDMQGSIFDAMLE